MTTKVTIDAHAGWPVEVLQIGAAAHAPAQVVHPGEVKDFHVHSGCDLLIREIQITNGQDVTQGEHMMQFFAWSHLPPHLQLVSAPFGIMAQTLIDTLPKNPERTVALRKLLEAKDAAVRAKVAA